MQTPDFLPRHGKPPSGDLFGGIVNPWRTIWTDPRMTVRWMAENSPAEWLWVLIVIGGMSRVMARVSELPVSGGVDSKLAFTLALVGGPIAGLLLIFGYGRLLHLILRRLGGIATWIGSRTAVAWSLAPAVPSLALWAIMISAYGVRVLSPAALEEAASPAEKLILGVDYLVQFALTLWSLVLEVITLADVHRISAWRVLFSELALGLAFALLAMLVVALL